jgi:aconitate decarboxylase
MLAILEDSPVTAADVAQVTVTTSRRNRGTLRFAQPQDALQAKFSMQFAMASALLRRRCSLQELQDDFVRSDEVRTLMARVEVLPEDTEDPRRPGEAPHDVVMLQTRNGQRWVREVDYARGGPERPLLRGELYGKFQSCLDYGRLAAEPRPLFDALMTIDELPGTAALYALARG